MLPSPVCSTKCAIMLHAGSGAPLRNRVQVETNCTRNNPGTNCTAKGVDFSQRVWSYQVTERLIHPGSSSSIHYFSTGHHVWTQHRLSRYRTSQYKQPQYRTSQHTIAQYRASRSRRVAA
eukprot:3654965-Rhodomonas_salina.2